jgi:uncharacterized protein
MGLKAGDIWNEGRLAAAGLRDFAAGVFNPTVRLGVSGLSRAGKTVFITALVHALLNSTRLPLFEAQSRGRIARAYLEPQPDDELPRFAYDEHALTLSGEDRRWPQSTSRISQLRLTIEYQPRGVFARNVHGGKLHIDIIDYPGEWLLDLPLLTQSYQQWSATTTAASLRHPRSAVAEEWHSVLSGMTAQQPAEEADAIKAAAAFTAYLKKCRDVSLTLSALPPGRFLLPGDLAGSPLLTFAPLDITPDAVMAAGSLGALMQRRYDAYVSKVVRPFFFQQFARLDRQIVLVDVMTALNAGASALADLQTALNDVVSCFRHGENSVLSSLFGHRIDRILFAATKADLLHHASHDRLENILRAIVAKSMEQVSYSGARHHVAALAAIRATREATVDSKGDKLPCIVGIPEASEMIGTMKFDGKTEAAIFPGDLPIDPAEALSGALEGKLHFVKFRPPLADSHYNHIRLDRTVEFLFGDKFS